MRKLVERMFRPVDAASLGVFRILFGELMVWEVVRYWAIGRVTRDYMEPRFHFPYPFFEWVRPWPGRGMEWHFAVMGLAALGIALGWWYRVCAALFCVTYAYVFLIDKTYYNNHYYLIVLLSFLLTVVDAHRWASVDRWRRPDLRDSHVPAWQVWILQAQIVVVHCYAGVAKLNGDWLCGEPMRHWLAARTDFPLIGRWFMQEWMVYLFSYGGLAFDLSIGWLLLWPRTRLPAVLWAVAFHLINNRLFSIGVFPLLMIATAVLFAEPDWPRKVVARIRHAPTPEASVSPGHPRHPRMVAGFLGVYLGLQVLVPLRHWLYPGDVAWTEEGHHFSWRMKLRDKDGSLVIHATDPKAGRTWTVDLTQDLTQKQIEEMSLRPDMIVQYAQWLGKKLEGQGIRDPVITVEAKVSLNGRKAQDLIDPTVNLALVRPSLWRHAAWITPLTTPLERCGRIKERQP